MRSLLNCLFVVGAAVWAPLSVAQGESSEYSPACTSEACQEKMSDLRYLAWHGSPEAQTIVAAAMVYGDGLDQNIRQGRMNLRKAMRNGHPVAWYTYALWRENGTAYEQDMEEAHEALLYAANELNYPPALYRLAAKEILNDGDMNVAMTYLQKAAARNHHSAQYLLAQLLANGVRVEPNLEQAAVLFHNLSLRNYRDSEQLLEKTMTLLGEQQPAERVAAVRESFRQPDQEAMEVIQVSSQRVSFDEMTVNMVDYIESFGLYDSNGMSNIAGQVCGKGTAMCGLVYSSRANDANPQKLFDLLSKIPYGNPM
ncbi:tetratricopeptide repeat protein [Pseudidiomarina woesei]|uniref:Sel1 repeat n=1 Tax=Pseudidiomarina woesei TaxID=1381080 RepID=A0A0K6GY91_9GAMM|nr:tetratricopeptide repeat protein [Pseudidiomarina woesei]CUA83545.1 Sel1 repeat [Pseudidiomarina woesei]